MPSIKPLTVSERYARSLLAAWNNRELTELKGLLAAPPFPDSEPVRVVERERVDLLQEIGRNLVIWEAAGERKNATNVAVAVALLRHLARYEEGANETISEMSLPLEMPASAQRSRYVH